MSIEVLYYHLFVAGNFSMFTERKRKHWFDWFLKKILYLSRHILYLHLRKGKDTTDKRTLIPGNTVGEKMLLHRR